MGYGYKRAEDPLVLSIKRIIYQARTDNWGAAEQEYHQLDWQFREFRQDLKVDLSLTFEGALASRSMKKLSRAICQVMYYALVQKFEWNLREKCRKYVPAKSRTDAALFYYQEILSIGVKDYDAKNKRDLHARVLKEFQTLRRSIGSSGLFGIGARKPDVQAFQTSAEGVLAKMREAFPYVVVVSPDASSQLEPPR